MDRIEWLGASKIAPVIGPPEMVWAIAFPPSDDAHAAKAANMAEYLIGFAYWLMVTGPGVIVTFLLLEPFVSASATPVLMTRLTHGVWMQLGYIQKR